jgi:hypothetical protein
VRLIDEARAKLLATKQFLANREERSLYNLAVVHPSHFSPSSVHFKSEINDAFPCKRHL